MSHEKELLHDFVVLHEQIETISVHLHKKKWLNYENRSFLIQRNHKTQSISFYEWMLFFKFS